ncbi:MAG: helix-turn-helix domain-containing protein [Peptococcaceae bacterium]|nr:helix-turn-helix domain-containing protein [Peptococcaceae bacterium]
MAGKLLTTGQVMEIFQVSRATVERWRKEGLKSFKIGRGVRFEEADIIEWKKSKSNYNGD